MNSDPVPHHLIEEARRRGIVPGAIIRCAQHPSDTDTVLPVERWSMTGRGSIRVSDHNAARAFYAGRDEWAQVITPAPSQGLQEGDAVECSALMFKAIVEHTKTLGLSTTPNMVYERLVWCAGRLESCAAPGESVVAKTWLSIPEFLSRLENTKPPVTKIMVGNREVEFFTDTICVGNTRDGYTVISNSKVLEIHDRMEAEPIVIDGHKAIITPDNVTVGCTTADKATIKAIVERIKK